MDKREKIKENLKKSGFVLEYQVAKILTDNNWKVISNKYYIDDVSGTPREIDILAYKEADTLDTKYYTTLLISCKKSEQNDWIMLTRNKSDNINKNSFSEVPFKHWTNSIAYDFIFNERDFEKEYIDKVTGSISQKIIKIEKDLFAFQEISKKNQSVQNDKKIFTSISTLIKSVAYELKKLQIKRKKRCLYNFYLISLCETELFEGFFENNDIAIHQIDSILFENQYIVDRIEDNFSINIVSFKYFIQILSHYNDIHHWNANYYGELLKKFYLDILIQRDKRWAFFKRTGINLYDSIKPYLKEQEIEGLNTYADLYLEFDGEKNKITLESEVFSDKVIDKLKENLPGIKSWFIKWVKFDGEIDFNYKPFEDHEFDHDDYFDYDEGNY